MEKIVINDKEIAMNFLAIFNSWTGVEQVEQVEEVLNMLPITITEQYMYCFCEDEYRNNRDMIIAGMSRSDFEASIETLKEISPDGWEIEEG